MHSRVLLLGLTGLLILGLLLGGCTLEEPAPTPSPTEPSPEEPATPTLMPAVTPSPPRPETPFVHKEEGILFQDDFEDRNADGWALDPGWDVKLEDGNYVLSGSGHQWARPSASKWTDYTIEAKIKLLAGGFHFNFRHNLGEVSSRYFLGMKQEGLYLQKQIGEDFFELFQFPEALELNKWYKAKIVVEGNNIRVYLDNALKIDYTDDDIPIRTGGFAFETLDNSQAYFDDITVIGTTLVQWAKWVKTGGPSGGLGYDVRIHPLDKNIMFVTDNPSGVNKSYDSGNTWVQRNTGITSRSGGSLDGIPIFCLTIDPNNPDIVWVGTQFMRGIFKSTDGGETWVKKDNGIAEFWEITFRGFAVHPRNSNIVFAGAEIDIGIRGVEFSKTKGKIYKTEDGGENWRCVWEGDNLARFIIFDPTNPDTLYASTGIFDREAYNEIGVGVLKSTDGGETWRQINNGIDNLFIGFLEMHPTNPQILFAAAGMVVAEREGNFGGVYRTTDGGDHWTQVLSSDYRVYSVVTISPSNPDVIYAGSITAFYRSDDGGNTWQRFWKPREHLWGSPGITAGTPISAVVAPDDPMTVFVNNYNGGVFKSTDGAETWTNSSEGYTGAAMRDIAIDADNPLIVYVAGRSGLFRSFESGRTWAGLAFGPASNEPYTVALSPDNSQELLSATDHDGTIIKSTDGGKSWRQVFRHPSVDPGDPQKWHGFKAIVYAPSNPEIVYAGMGKTTNIGMVDPSLEPSFGIYKSVDGGETWTEKNFGLENSTKIINHIVVHPRNPDIVYIATLHDGVYKTTDGGESWVPVNNGLMSLDVRSLDIDPKDLETVYAGLAEGVGIFKTTNGGELWEGINYGIRVECPSFLQRVGQVRPGISLVKPKRLAGVDYYSIPWTTIRSIVIDPVEPSTIYAADFSLGVYMSTDGGLTWTPINEGLSTKAVIAMALSSDGWVLYAATDGEGVFRLKLW